jgi:hypothetical protein
METQLSVSHRHRMVSGRRQLTSRLMLHVRTAVGATVMIVDLVWNSPPRTGEMAVNRLMGFADNHRHACLGFVVALPDPVPAGLALATQDFFGKPKAIIDRGLQKDLLIDGRRKKVSKLASQIEVTTDTPEVRSIEQYLLDQAYMAYAELG